MNKQNKYQIKLLLKIYLLRQDNNKLDNYLKNEEKYKAYKFLKNKAKKEDLP